MPIAIRDAIADLIAERHAQYLADADAYLRANRHSRADPYTVSVALGDALGLSFAERHAFAQRVADPERQSAA